MTLRLIIEAEAETELEEAADRYKEERSRPRPGVPGGNAATPRDVPDNPRRFPPFGGVEASATPRVLGRPSASPLGKPADSIDLHHRSADRYEMK